MTGMKLTIARVPAVVGVNLITVAIADGVPSIPLPGEPFVLGDVAFRVLQRAWRHTAEGGLEASIIIIEEARYGKASNGGG